MKNRILFLLLVSTPIAAFSQAPALENSNGFITILITLIVCVLVFLLCREIVCWYWKINKIASNQEEIIRLLKKIANEENILQ